MSKSLIIASLLIAFTQTANATAKWVRIGNTDFFYDSNSLNLNGEIASMDVRKTGPNSGYGNWEIDCKRRLLLTGQESHAIKAGDDLEPVANRACKQKWQFWK